MLPIPCTACATAQTGLEKPRFLEFFIGFLDVNVHNAEHKYTTRHKYMKKYLLIHHLISTVLQFIFES